MGPTGDIPMTNNDQQQAAAVENAAAGHGGLSQSELDALVASSDTGGRAVGGNVEIGRASCRERV